MIPKKLTVIVSGPPASGKSILSDLIREQLFEEGMKIDSFGAMEQRYPVSTSERRKNINWIISATQVGEVEVSVVEVNQPPSDAAGIEAIYQRSLLINQIDRFLRRVGVIDKKAPELTGAEALYQLDIYGQHLEEKAAGVILHADPTTRT